MAGISFAPRESGIKYLYSTRKYRYAQKSSASNEKFPASLGAWNYVEQPYASASKSAYQAGIVTTLPGGYKFRKATGYTVSNREIIDQGGIYTTDYWTKGVNWQNKLAEDDGREMYYVLSNAPLIRSHSSIIFDARNEAVTKALNQIADQKVNLGENLATLGQTARLFSNKAELLYRLCKYGYKQKSWRKLLRKSARDLYRAGPLTVAAQEYLAFVYGLQPLVNDIYTLAEMMKKQGVKPLLFKGVGRAARFETEGSVTRGPMAYTKLTQLDAQGTYKVKCTLWARINPDAAGLRAINQLGLLNPFGLAWDLVPFSFVVDWFLPVGPVLYAMTAPMGLIFVDGSVSMRSSEFTNYNYQVQTVTYYYNPENALFKEGSESKYTVSRKVESYTRLTLGTWPLPGLWFDSDPLRMDRPLKALALGIIGLSGARSPVR